MAYLILLNPFFLFISLFILLIHLPVHQAVNSGFSVKLIRKNSTNTPFQRLTDAAQTNSYVYLGEYLLELSIGTPPVNIYGILDTSSDLIWTQCAPCLNCYKQLDPLFDPKKSSTYTDISCQSDKCHLLIAPACSGENTCDYTYGYADSSVTRGALASETITFKSSTGQPIQLNNIIFGCGNNNRGNFNDHEMGIIGLGRGPTSLISQIGSSVGGKKFSQCLVPFHTDISISSKMSFGQGSEVLGDGVVSTPLVKGEIGSAYGTVYFVTLQGISVEDTRFQISNNSETLSKGNMLIDSGTPSTILQQESYDQVFNEVRKRVPMNSITDDPDLGPQLCYKTSTNLKGPMITMHFEGADIQLTPTQTFIPPKDGVFCFAFTNTSNGDPGTLGNFAQANFLIGYDLENDVVSFKPTDCTK
ncbi:PREDICTED: aspartic proteinase CDR1-like [Lupinus angustifolius]|uniref:aspartic proteinase CDR1-like n=1 Tax=Lupinus angustifolius TaxID=3871 RepID=UPI00092EEBB9|nr:PREDICTED: aspartic proteinase CDR1-like [Lupinus angustifolius]